MHLTLKLFMDYLIDGRYGWATECERRFGTHPVQICHEWNTVAHVGDYEGRPTNRPLSRPELQRLFNAVDDRAERVRRQGRDSYVTHLIEDGFEPLFVQQQVGHAWASTTALYTGVSSDFKNRSLRLILDRRLGRTTQEG